MAGCGLDLRQVHRSHVELYARQLEADGKAAATVAHRLSAVISFYRGVINEELLQRPATSRVRRPRVRREPASAGLSGLEAARSTSSTNSRPTAIGTLP